MKSIIKLTTFITVGVLFTQCYKQNEYWLDKNIKEGGTYFPVIQSFSIEDPNPDDGESPSFSSGETVTLNLYYWSRDEVKSLDFFESKNGSITLVESLPYQDSFDPESESQLYKYNYTIPYDVEGNLAVVVEVVTIHDLKKRTSPLVIPLKE